MYFSAGLKVRNHIYLIECHSRCLISIHIPSGEAKIESYLPWEYTEHKIGMLSLNNNIFIYSPVVDHFLVYDCLKRQMTSVKLEGIEPDAAGFYYSNVLITQDNFIVLPFKGKKIKWYGMNGKLNFSDTEWLTSISKEIGCNEQMFGNIRMDSACIVGTQLFFSLICGNQNYLCEYELNKHSCNIIYHSEDIAIRGVYAYPNMILFRKIFTEKTEIVLTTLDFQEQKTIMISYPTLFEEDIFGDIHRIRGSFKNTILEIKGDNSNSYQKIYNFEPLDAYITNGILFNILKNEILILDKDYIKKYSIKKIMDEIKSSSSYQTICRKLFSGKYVQEGRYKLYNLIEYLTEIPPVLNREKNFLKNHSNGELTWKMLY